LILLLITIKLLIGIGFLDDVTVVEAMCVQDTILSSRTVVSQWQRRRLFPHEYRICSTYLILCNSCVVQSNICRFICEKVTRNPHRKPHLSGVVGRAIPAENRWPTRRDDGTRPRILLFFPQTKKSFLFPVLYFFVKGTIYYLKRHFVFSWLDVYRPHPLMLTQMIWESCTPSTAFCSLCRPNGSYSFTEIKGGAIIWVTIWFEVSKEKY